MSDRKKYFAVQLDSSRSKPPARCTPPSAISSSASVPLHHGDMVPAEYVAERVKSSKATAAPTDVKMSPRRLLIDSCLARWQYEIGDVLILSTGERGCIWNQPFSPKNVEIEIAKCWCASCSVVREGGRVGRVGRVVAYLV